MRRRRAPRPRKNKSIWRWTRVLRTLGSRKMRSWLPKDSPCSNLSSKATKREEMLDDSATMKTTLSWINSSFQTALTSTSPREATSALQTSNARSSSLRRTSSRWTSSKTVPSSASSAASQCWWRRTRVLERQPLLSTLSLSRCRESNASFTRVRLRHLVTRSTESCRKSLVMLD